MIVRPPVRPATRVVTALVGLALLGACAPAAKVEGVKFTATPGGVTKWFVLNQKVTSGELFASQSASVRCA